MSVSIRRLTTTLLLSLFALAVAVPVVAKPAIRATLWHNPGCQCCAKYAQYLDQHGFAVKVIDSSDLAAVFREHAVPDKLVSCHLMTVGRYTVVGHVPVDVVQKLLREHPAIRGISLPGMPGGSPGMGPDSRMGGPKTAPFVIYTFGVGNSKVYATR
jgi:hypothetical protein